MKSASREEQTLPKAAIDVPGEYRPDSIYPQGLGVIHRIGSISLCHALVDRCELFGQIEACPPHLRIWAQPRIDPAGKAAKLGDLVEQGVVGGKSGKLVTVASREILVTDEDPLTWYHRIIFLRELLDVVEIMRLEDAKIQIPSHLFQVPMELLDLSIISQLKVPRYRNTKSTPVQYDPEHKTFVPLGRKH